MCDYSLQHSKTRPASVGDKLTTYNFGRGTKGFKGIDENPSTPFEATAVCVLPGTELAFDTPIEAVSFYHAGELVPEKVHEHKTARFRQINLETPLMHHDCVELPDGTQILLNHLKEGCTATVLQLPAKPKNEAEAKEQTRLEVVA